jgi:murein DD-endopeptidase MepM/ murein hydrolase activator NlpD
VLYQEVWVDGAYDGPGTILALSYQNGGRRLEAYRYADRGYYDGEGRPLQKMFLRSPLPYSRITSRFSNRRFHPILKVYRPHHGIDYGAPVGTAVRVTAGGVVAFAGWDGGGGKTVKVRHPNGYLTAYLHLSRYAAGIHAGARVRQGDVIGHVGATGLATAAHLDYRVQRQGRWIDPLALVQVPAPDIPVAELADFRSLRDVLRSSLGQPTVLAEAGARPGEDGAIPVAAARR